MKEERLIDQYRTATYAYWTALLTINGLFLGFFSIEALGDYPGALHVVLIGC